MMKRRLYVRSWKDEGIRYWLPVGWLFIDGTVELDDQGDKMLQAENEIVEVVNSVDN